MNDHIIEILFKFWLTTLLCGLIGFEREVRHKGAGAGLRTHILVGLGSCLIVLTSIHIFDIYKNITPVDPSRIISSIVTGIGFLCAGTIIRGGTQVVGLTTAATVWIASALGMAVGVAQYVESTIFAVLVFVILTSLRSMEKRWLGKQTVNPEEKE